MARIVIFGGHGRVALRLAPLLVDAGHQVGAIVRNAEHFGDVADSGASPIVANIEYLDTTKIAALIECYDVVVWLAGAGVAGDARTYAVDRDAAIRSMDAAGRTSISRYLMMSYFGAGLDHGFDPGSASHAYAQAKAGDYLEYTSLAWTILAPSALTLAPGTGRIVLKENGATVSSATRDDVAAVAAAAIDNPNTFGRRIEFDNGATPISEALHPPGAQCGPSTE